jgi:hypothetical protein
VSGDHEHSAPPSAAGLLEPFGVRVQFGPVPERADGSDPEGLLTGLLEDLAAACESAGATVIGHIKCFMTDGSAVMQCSLTSRRFGAQCSPGTGVVSLARPVELDLAVLVYGLPRDVIAQLTRETLDRRLGELGIAWRQL